MEKLKSKSLIPVFALIGLLAPTGPAAQASSPQPPAWNKKMKELEATLVDAYPFFFTLTAFRKPENDRIVKKLISDIQSHAHEMPVAEGEKILGTEPLIAQAQIQMAKSFADAEIAFNKKEYDKSQRLIHEGIGLCVACHTAQGYGRRFQKRNDEMFNIYTPTQDKVTGLIAIRQFDSALAAIENTLSGRSKYKDDPAQFFQLVKLHLLVSIRAMDDLERARKFLKSASGNAQMNASDKTVISRWDQKLETWMTVRNQSIEKKMNWIDSTLKTETGDAAYAVNLLKSRMLHQSFATEMKDEDKASAYLSLATAYRDLNVPQLAPLIKIYSSACTELKVSEAIRKQCRSNL